MSIGEELEIAHKRLMQVGFVLNTMLTKRRVSATRLHYQAKKLERVANSLRAIYPLPTQDKPDERTNT